jgi:hypothetical protein
MKKSLIAILMAIILFACSNPMSRKYSNDTMADDLKAISEAKKLDSTDFFLLSGYLLKSAFTGESLNDYTYSDILKKAKDYRKQIEEEEKEERELAEKARKEEEAKIKTLKEALTVTVFDKGYVKVNYEDFLTYKFAFENKTEKEIRAFKGTITFNDLFDTEIKSISITYDKPIKAKEGRNYEASTDYNQYRDSDKLLKNKELKDIKVLWRPEKILFSDGTTIEL